LETQDPTQKNNKKNQKDRRDNSNAVLYLTNIKNLFSQSGENQGKVKEHQETERGFRNDEESRTIEILRLHVSNLL